MSATISGVVISGIFTFTSPSAGYIYKINLPDHKSYEYIHVDTLLYVVDNIPILLRLV